MRSYRYRQGLPGADILTPPQPGFPTAWRQVRAPRRGDCTRCQGDGYGPAAAPAAPTATRRLYAHKRD